VKFLLSNRKKQK